MPYFITKRVNSDGQFLNFMLLCRQRDFFTFRHGFNGGKKQFEMKRIRKTIFAAGALFILLAAGWYFLFYCGLLFQQTLIGTSTSPGKSYTIYAYTYNFGNFSAAAETSVFCRVEDNRGGMSRSLYRSSGCRFADIHWNNETTVSINGIVLNVRTGFYNGTNSLFGTAGNTDKSVLYIAKYRKGGSQ